MRRRIALLTPLLSLTILIGLVSVVFAQTAPPFMGKFGSVGSGSGQYSNPYFGAIDPTTGNVLVANMGNNRIEVSSSTGTFIRSWGSNGSGDGQFRGIEGLATANDLLYVCDSKNRRVLLLALSRQTPLPALTPAAAAHRQSS